MPAACTLELKVIPNAPRNEVPAGWSAALKVKIRAPALDGRANEALAEFLAERLGLRAALSLSCAATGRATRSCGSTA